jgi:hypothetical protein
MRVGPNILRFEKNVLVKQKTIYAELRKNPKRIITSVGKWGRHKRSGHI